MVEYHGIRTHKYRYGTVPVWLAAAVWLPLELHRPVYRPPSCRAAIDFAA